MDLITKITQDHKERIRLELDEHPPFTSKQNAWEAVQHLFPPEQFSHGARAVAQAYTESYVGSREHAARYH